MRRAGRSHVATVFSEGNKTFAMKMNSIQKGCGCFPCHTTCTCTKVPFYVLNAVIVISFLNWSQNGRIQRTGHGT